MREVLSRGKLPLGEVYNEALTRATRAISNHSQLADVNTPTSAIVSLVLSPQAHNCLALGGNKMSIAQMPPQSGTPVGFGMQWFGASASVSQIK